MSILWPAHWNHCQLAPEWCQLCQQHLQPFLGLASVPSPVHPYATQDLPLKPVRTPQTLRDSPRQRGAMWKKRALDIYDHVPGLVNVYVTMERSTMLLMGKSTISMAIFNSYVSSPEGRLADWYADKMRPLVIRLHVIKPCRQWLKSASEAFRETKLGKTIDLQKIATVTLQKINLKI